MRGLRVCGFAHSGMVLVVRRDRRTDAVHSASRNGRKMRRRDAPSVTDLACRLLLLSSSKAILLRSGPVHQQFSGGQTGNEAERKRRREASRALLAQFEKTVQPVRQATAFTSACAARLIKAGTNAQ